MIRPDVAALWAFSATLTSAASTVVYLLFIHQQSWAPHFIQLYSSIGIVAGWLNALIYFLAPRSIFLQTRKAGFLFFLLAIALVSLVYAKVFRHPLQPDSLLFIATSLIPILYANAFGLEFFEGNYPWPYVRVVAFNVLVMLAGFAAFSYEHTETALFRCTGVVGLWAFIFWVFDRWNRIDVPRERSRSLKPWLNPSLPVLDRTLWDQWALARLDVLQWSFPIYALSRLITFGGNFTYSYLLGTNSSAKSREFRKSNRWIWAILILALPVAAAAVKYSWCAFLLGQIFAWQLTAHLSSEFNEKGAQYNRYLLIWFLDLALRAVGIFVAQDLQDYTPFLIASSVTGLILSLLLWLKKPGAPSPRKANTKLPPADFLSIR